MTNTKTQENTNEVAVKNENAGLVVHESRFETISETESFVVVRDKESGKFSRKAKYNSYSSIVATDRAEKIWLMNLLEGEEENGSGLKDNIGAVIEVANIITRPYDKINEENGEVEYGVLTYLITPDKTVYASSSKNVYFSINKMMELFGKPTDETWENISVAVKSEKGTNGDIIKIKMVG